jgi:SAM-dependent methyltransferase
MAGVLYPLKRVLERTAGHDEIYDANYYNHVDNVMNESNEVIADSIVSTFGPKAILDVGCGTGALLMALTRRGVKTSGLEYSSAALNVCHSRGLDVKRFDLEHDRMEQPKVDVVISTEVAEHLPPAIADRFVDALCASAPIVVITAATPGQGGTDHVNEQPHEYWIEKFRQRGLVYRQELSERWRRNWVKAGTAPCYSANVMIFQSKESLVEDLAAQRVPTTGVDRPVPAAEAAQPAVTQ